MRQSVVLIFVVWSALASRAGALEPGPALLNGRGGMGVPAIPTPQGPVEVSRVVWQAVLDRYPEISEGPERAGTYLVGLLLRRDGSIEESVLAYAPTAARLHEAAAPIVDLIPRDLPMGAIAPAAAGSVVATREAQRVLRASVRVRHRLIPDDWDTTRNAERVERVLRRQRPEYFDATRGNPPQVLTIFLDDAGRIMREQRESGGSDPARMTRLMSATQPGDFQSLGIEPARIGVTGVVIAARNLAAVTDEQRHPLGADGLPVRAFGSAIPGTAPLIVRYAWERRPGEAVGGDPSGEATAPSVVSRLPPAGAGRMIIAERPPHPSQIPGEGAPWVLMSFDGKVLRTGRVRLPEGEPLLRTHLERLMPGIRIWMSQTISFSGRPGGLPGEFATLTSFVLESGSPLPPEDQDAR